MAKPKIDLAGKTALVTGGGSGIGRATALAFARAGCHVLVADINEAAAEKVAAECQEAGATADALVCDVTDSDAVAALATDVEARFGSPDILVNNAGVGLTGRLLETTLDDWRWVRSVNLDGVMHCCYAFGPGMVNRGSGHVVNVSSGLAYTPRATEPGYVATKAAVLALSMSLRGDWGPSGIGVSAVCPGVINTPIAQNTRYRGARADAKTRARIEKGFGRSHAPEKVATAIVKAVQQNTPVVPVGAEAHVGWWFHRLAPAAWHARLARSRLL
jgi:NAD(P)-dependent dehydrogenase (short-subunit alcohol dehydrogenase family)